MNMWDWPATTQVLPSTCGRSWVVLCSCLLPNCGCLMAWLRILPMRRCAMAPGSTGQGVSGAVAGPRWQRTCGLQRTAFRLRRSLPWLTRSQPSCCKRQTFEDDPLPFRRGRCHGLDDILSADEIHLIVTGAAKRRSCTALLEHCRDAVPASWLRHPRVHLWVDDAASAHLQLLSGWQFWLTMSTFTDLVGQQPDGQLVVRKVLSVQPGVPGDPAGGDPRAAGPRTKPGDHFGLIDEFGLHHRSHQRPAGGPGSRCCSHQQGLADLLRIGDRHARICLPRRSPSRLADHGGGRGGGPSECGGP